MRLRPAPRIFATALTFLLALSLARAARAQRPRASADSSQRADYKNLDELLQKIPNVAPPTLDETRALWLAALPMSCLDRLQPRPGNRGGRGTTIASADSSAGRGATRAPANPRADSGGRRGAGRGNGAPAGTAAGPNNGAGYFWSATYTLAPDHDRLRAFWGCNDWHSAVSATWAIVRLLETHPHSALRDLAVEKLNAHLGKSNLDGEFEFFKAVAAAINPIPSANQTGFFERPYGFAWLLELAAELHAWPDSQAKRWSANVAPLAAWMADSLGASVGKLVEPVRGGTQNNTALSMTLALDYADAQHDAKLRAVLASTARKFYLGDTTCATQREGIVPAAARRGAARGAAGRGSGARDEPGPDEHNDLTANTAGARGAQPAGGGAAAEIVSPCLTEAALMSHVLEPRAYQKWLGRFLPPLESGRFAPLTEAIGIPSPAAPATERARLAGLSFSRAQAMERVARGLPAADPRVAALHRLAAVQADRGFDLMRADDAGISWLPAQALLYERLRAQKEAVATTAATNALDERRRHIDSSTSASPQAFSDLSSFSASLPSVEPRPFDEATALLLSSMPLACMDHPQPRPNGTPYLWLPAFTPVTDFETTRVFYGCYDWHSAVNSAWTLVRILKMFPELPTGAAIRQKLNDHFGATNAAGDLQFMRGAGAFELPYGYAWLLRLQYELRSWNDSESVRWAANLQPLATYMSQRFATYLDSLQQPVRTGVHPNTAMAMDNALGYARAFDPALDSAINRAAVRLFKHDVHCNTAAEPGPSDFASPCLMEAAIMGQLMDRDAFLPWLDQFLPPLYSKEFHPLTVGLGPEFVKNPAAIASKSHIVGLAFVRATSMGELADALPASDPRVPVLRRLAAMQAATGFPLMGAVGYDGSHYYASWATTYLITKPLATGHALK